MKLRAVVFDIYGTLLDVGPPPPNADATWRDLLQEFLPSCGFIERVEFSVAANKVIARHHEVARSRSIPWPEVHWPSVVAEVLPGFGELPQRDQKTFLARHVQTGRTTRLVPEAASALRAIAGRGCLLGIASNAQDYTRAELQEALESRGMGLHMFKADLSFWSYENGFSKPDPHVFRILSSRLANYGIRPGEALMVGDRVDNDIAPAKAQGWQTWHVVPPIAANWIQLQERVCGATGTSGT